MISSHWKERYSTYLIKERYNHNQNLNILRLFAAFMVLLVHINGLCYQWEFAGAGKYGVKLFFILSGYLITQSLSKEQSLKQYFKKRVISIVPAYYSILLIQYIFNIVNCRIHGCSWVEVFITGSCSYRYFRYFLFLQMFLPSDDFFVWNNSNALWTMSAFVLFYLIAPIIRKAIDNFEKSIITLVAMLMITPLWKSMIFDSLNKISWVSHADWFSTMNPISCLVVFMIGVTVYHSKEEGKQIIITLLACATLVFTQFQWYQFDLLFGILLCMVVSVNDSRFLGKYGFILYEVGRESFSLYLCHPMILLVVSMLGNYFNWFNSIKLIVGLGGSIVGTFIFHNYIVAPITKRLKNALD